MLDQTPTNTEEERMEQRSNHTIVDPKLTEIVENVIGFDINDDDVRSKLTLLGIDSIGKISIILHIEESFGVDIKPSNITEETTLTELNTLLDEALASSRSESARDSEIE